MHEHLTLWLSQQGISQDYLTLSALMLGMGLILLLGSLAYYLTKHQLLALIHKIAIESENTWDDLFVEQKVFSRMALLLPLILLFILIPVFLPIDSFLSTLLVVLVKVAVSFQLALSISAVLNVINCLHQQSAKARYLPLNTAIQVLKLIVYLIATILAISFVLDRSPLYLLSGLGALTAVLILVFQDTIKGLVASVQISANRMVAPGDWIELPKYGADGDVIEIGLNTVKVRNFDNTVTTVPTYALTTGSFKNWRDMFQSGGRRIKRSLIIDINSIKFCDDAQIARLCDIELITAYLTHKKQQISVSTEQAGINLQLNESKQANIRQLTNVGTFRAYIEAYLQQHEKVQHNMTCMVRQLPPTDSGLPLELYFFSSDQNWVNYESIQADIFDHLFAIAPRFELRFFQHPSGYDFNTLAK
jgi:miniconductance mechanosensitive channel